MDDTVGLDTLSVDQLIDMIREKTGAGVNLAFPGKLLARQIGRRVRPRTVRTIKTLGAGDEQDRSRNLLIDGDNLQALASLYREKGQIDLILTDPPYNTGNDFRYNDKWDHDPNDPDMGELVGSDDPAKHTKWMRFMYPRLQMMKAMLKTSGVLAICIDHRELFHLGQLLDEIFGEQNRLAILNWQKSYSPKSGNDHVSTATEYVLVYAKDERVARTGLLDRTEEMDARYTTPDGDTHVWTSGDLSAVGAESHQGMVFGIQSPLTGEVHYPPSGRHWGTDRRTIRAWLQEWGVKYEERDLHDGEVRAQLCGLDASAVRPHVKALMIKGELSSAMARARAVYKSSPWPSVYFLGKEGAGRPRLKRYLENVKKGLVPMTYWADDDMDSPMALGSVSWDHEQSGHSQTGINELNAIVGRGHGFETVKPLKLMQKIIQIWCPLGGTVLDPFAGSGTTGHAVLSLNAAQNADRQFILIEQGRPEKGDSYARTLTADRLKRCVTGEWSSGKGKPLGGGFAYAKLSKQLDSETLLLMERDEMIDTVVASHTGSSRRRGGIIHLPQPEKPYRFLIAKNADEEGIYLVWNGSEEDNDLTEDVYEEIVDEGVRAGLASSYHVYSRLNLFVTDDVHWYQIPDRILQDFGVDIRTESFVEA
ncbi:site-specific DNA-methyltransferase [Citricoccus muralis]|uniref:Adenine-specific DNA-methyltransferase n=1 Tax=Citricoccus muralis TaxID=169134 RepID=A0A3D9L9J6_9MICC|nr:site-specific DNA-methyltransferase [Citricoccus muralis]REE02316.1 adenine-specific DNA-methyltransferase [Citricoccus muralis]